MEPFFADFVERLHALNQSFIRTFEDLPNAALDWQPGDDMNSFTVLVVHTTASARFWIGDVGLGEPSNRDRDAEFRARGLTIAELKERFTTLDAYVQQGVERLSVTDLATIRPIPNRAMDRSESTAGWALLHALQHTGLHLGHAEITRQLWQKRDGQGRS